jgi:hypothetical protein
MAEVLAELSDHILGEDGVVYRAQIAGAAMPDGRWEGWVEFIPISGGPPLRTPRETTQPNRRDAVHWAAGITAVYLEGALHRALRPLVQRVPAPPEPMFDEPAPSIVRAVEPPITHAVLDPFEVHENNGEVILRGKLNALDALHLINIIVAYKLSEEPVSTLEELSASSLIEIIVGAVRARSVRS